MLKVADLGESQVDDRVGHLIANSENPTVGVLAHPGQVDVRITTKASSQQEGERLIEPLEREVRELLGEHVFGSDDQTMQRVVGDLLRRAGNLTIASYEGLTGGLVAQQLQEAAGSLFLKGTIGRGEGVLRHLLETGGGAAGNFEELANDGARLADQLAAAVRAGSGADYGLAVHAVPEAQAATENLSAGQTYLSICSSSGTSRRLYNFAGPGLPDRTRSAIYSLDLLRVAILHRR